MILVYFTSELALAFPQVANVYSVRFSHLFARNIVCFLFILKVMIYIFIKIPACHCNFCMCGCISQSRWLAGKSPFSTKCLGSPKHPGFRFEIDVLRKILFTGYFVISKFLFSQCVIHLLFSTGLFPMCFQFSPQPCCSVYYISSYHLNSFILCLLPPICLFLTKLLCLNNRCRVYDLRMYFMNKYVSSCDVVYGYSVVSFPKTSEISLITKFLLSSLYIT